MHFIAITLSLFGAATALALPNPTGLKSRVEIEAGPAGSNILVLPVAPVDEGAASSSDTDPSPACTSVTGDATLDAQLARFFVSYPAALQFFEGLIGPSLPSTVSTVITAVSTPTEAPQ